MEIKNSTLEQESGILDYFRNLNTTNPKKIKRLAQRLYFAAQHDLQRKVCKDILDTKDPYGMITDYLNRIDDFIILSKQFVEDGHHGILFTGDNGDIVYPITLDTLPHWLDDPNDKWNEDDEKEIMLNLAKEYLRTTTLKRTLVKVVLFQDFGFSGAPRIFEVRRED